MVQALIESTQTQARQLEVLKRTLETEAAEVLKKEAEHAALLDEARRELAEKVAAFEIEKGNREIAERRLAELNPFVEWIRSMPPLPASDGTAAPAVAPAANAPDAAGEADADEGSGATAEIGPELAEVVVAADDGGDADHLTTPAVDPIDTAVAVEEPSRVVIAIEIADHQAAMLDRAAQARGMTTASFVIYCVEREVGSSAGKNPGDGEVSDIATGPADPGG